MQDAGAPEKAGYRARLWLRSYLPCRFISFLPRSAPKCQPGDSRLAENNRAVLRLFNGNPLEQPRAVEYMLGAMRSVASKRTWIVLVLLIIAILFIAAWLVRRASVHPQFGLIQITGMAMRSPYPPLTLWQKAEICVRSWLRLQQRYGSKSDYGLQVGTNVLGWSYRNNVPNNRDGYIYMCDVRPKADNGPLWEFALSNKQHLRDVTREDLRCEFYGMNDPRGTNVFGSAWRGRTIIVPEGQIFFARLETNRSVVYVVRLAKQHGVPKEDWATMKTEYVVANDMLPNGVGPANGSQPIRSETNSTSPTAGSRR